LAMGGRTGQCQHKNTCCQYGQDTKIGFYLHV
jgi:hypothetical protein